MAEKKPAKKAHKEKDAKPIAKETAAAKQAAEEKKGKMPAKEEAAPKAEEKKEKAPAKETAKQQEKKPPAKKKKFVEKFENPGKSPEIKKIRDAVKKKKRLLFRGRFGQRNMIRNIRNPKWQKWRKTRGIDISHKKDDGLIVSIGYRTPKKIRFRHPSGFREVFVHNVKEIEAIAKDNQSAAKIAAGVGLRKRNEIVKKAKELKIWVLNA